MEAWKEQLLHEENALSTKIINLSKTINRIVNENYGFKPKSSIELLTMQLNAMTTYQQILRVRIEIEIPREE